MCEVREGGTVLFLNGFQEFDCMLYGIEASHRALRKQNKKTTTKFLAVVD